MAGAVFSGRCRPHPHPHLQTIIDRTWNIWNFQIHTFVPGGQQGRYFLVPDFEALAIFIHLHLHSPQLEFPGLNLATLHGVNDWEPQVLARRQQTKPRREQTSKSRLFQGLLWPCARTFYVRLSSSKTLGIQNTH